MASTAPFCLSTLQLLQLADSALPIGSLSHSFGLETLVSDEDIDSTVGGCPQSLAEFLEDSLAEALLVDAVFCRAAHRCALLGEPIDDLNHGLSALRLARESREASLTMGRRFVALAAALHPNSALHQLMHSDELHHSVAFGSVFGILAIDADLAVAAYLHQCVLNTISAAQRLLPLGQTQANRIAWQLKPSIMAAVERTRELEWWAIDCFAHLPEIASMRHPCLSTRLFIS